MPDRDSFIAAIAANPADDLPRLVFADWLDENGDPDRARFIRDQIALTKLRPGTDEYKATFRRTADTLRANLPAWIQSACDAFGQPTDWKPGKATGGRFSIHLQDNSSWPLWRLEFSRGMIEQVTLRMSNVKRAQELSDLFRSNPITQLTAAHLPHPAGWESVVTPELRRVRQLVIGDGAYAQTADVVFATPFLDQVTRLAIKTASHAERLIRSPMARRLTALRVSPDIDLINHLHEYPLDDRLQEFAVLPISVPAALRAILPSQQYSTATELWSALSRVAFRPTLKRLDLTRCRITDDGLAAFARGEEWLRLQGLKLGGNLFGDSGWADFARGWRTPELTYLDVSRNRLTDVSAETLARSGMIQTLRTIDLRGCRIGGRGAVALANAVRSGPLRSLLLAGNPLKPRDITAIRKVLGERVDVG